MWLLTTTPGTPRATSTLLCLIVTLIADISSWRFSKILEYQTRTQNHLNPLLIFLFPPLHLKNLLQEQQLETLVSTYIFTFFVSLQRWSKEALFR